MGSEDSFRLVDEVTAGAAFMALVALAFVLYHLERVAS
jgi:hypothetical protein